MRRFSEAVQAILATSVLVHHSWVIRGRELLFSDGFESNIDSEAVHNNHVSFDCDFM